MSMLVVFYHPYAERGGGALGRFLYVKEVWAKMGLRMHLVESSPASLSTAIRAPTPIATRISHIPVEIVRGGIYIVFSVLYGLFSSSDFDIILCPNNDLISMISALLISKVKKKKSIVVLHHIDLVSYGKNLVTSVTDMYTYARGIYGAIGGLAKSLTAKVNMILIPGFNACICVSRVFGKLFPNSYNSTNGIDARLLKRIESFDRNEEKPYDASYVGRLSPEKGVAELLKIWEIVNSQMKREASLVLIGPDQMNVNEYIDLHGLGDFVEYKGILNEDDKIETLMKARVFVTASRSEGWGLAIAEALLCGLPVVCLNVVALRAEWQECPYVFFANDVRDLARRVISLLSGKYHFDSAKIRKWALERLKTFDYVAQKDLEIIFNIMKDGAKV